MMIMLPQPEPDSDNPVSSISMAQITHTILLTRAAATSISGILSNIYTILDPSWIFLRPSQFNRVIAPNDWKSENASLPAFDTLPSRTFPPEEYRLGTIPSQAAKSRLHLKLFVDGAKAYVSPVPSMTQQWASRVITTKYLFYRKSFNLPCPDLIVCRLFSELINQAQAFFICNGEITFGAIAGLYLEYRQSMMFSHGSGLREWKRLADQAKPSYPKAENWKPN